MLTFEDIALYRNLQEEFEFSGKEQTEVATDKVDFSPGGYVRNNGFFCLEATPLDHLAVFAV